MADLKTVIYKLVCELLNLPSFLCCVLSLSHLGSLHQSWPFPQVLKFSFLYTLSPLQKLICLCLIPFIILMLLSLV